MNKFGIKVYADEVYENYGIHYTVNSIKYHKFTHKNEVKFRVINWNKFGIKITLR